MPLLDDADAVYFGALPIKVMYREGVEVWPKRPVLLAAVPAGWEQIDLTITPPMTGADSYILKRDGTQIYAGAALTFSDTALMPSTLYTYTVDAIRGSTVHSTATASATTAARAAMVITGSSPRWDQVVLSWTDPGGGSVDGYRVKNGATVVYTGAALAYTDQYPTSALMPSTAYSYTVEAMRGAVVVASSAASVTTVAHDDLALVGNAVAYKQVDLSWSAALGSVDEFLLYRDATLVYQGVGTSKPDTGLSQLTTYNYTLYARRAGIDIKTDTHAVATPAVPVVYTWAYGSTSPNDADWGYKQTSVKYVAGENVQLVGGENHLVHVTFRAASYGVTYNLKGRFAAWVGGVYFGNEHIKDLPYPNWNDFGANPDHCILPGGVHATQLRLGGVGETIDSGCHPNGGSEGVTISDWGSGWWAASVGQTASSNVCTYGVYYWYYAYRADFDAMAVQYEWMTPELAVTLTDRNLQMFTWCEPNAEATIIKVQIGDYDTQELLLDWEAVGYTRKNPDQPTWNEWLAKRNATWAEDASDAAAG